MGPTLKRHFEDDKKLKKPETAEFQQEQEDWDVLPCEGIFKLSRRDEKITYTHCRAPYWKCPNKNCVMNLV